VTVESRRAAAPPMVLAATLGLAAACWAAAAWLMNGMDMGVATRPGAFGFFVIVFAPSLVPVLTPRLLLPERTKLQGPAERGRMTRDGARIRSEE